MNKEFLQAALDSKCSLLTWLGIGVLLYDGGLCVNRDAEEHKMSNEEFARRRMYLTL